MVTVIDNGGFSSLQSKLEKITLPNDIQVEVILDHSLHVVIFNNQAFSLDYHSNEFQRLLSSNHPLLSAIGSKPGSLLDACGGLGKDSFIAAHNGFDVLTCESSLLIYTLLEQAVTSYTSDSRLKWVTSHRLAQTVMANRQFDIVYLDPMFQAKRTAKPKQGMQLLQLAADQSPFNDWQAAWHCAKGRLVIKQYAKSSIIEDLPPPSYQVTGKRNVRYDIYLKTTV